MNYKKSKEEPFVLVKNEQKKVVICVGQAQVSSKEFNNFRDAEDYIRLRPYELIFNTMFYAMYIKDEESKKNAEKNSAVNESNK